MNRFRLHLLAIFILVCSPGSQAWAETNCEASLNSKSYSQAIEELAQGYITLEKLKIEDASPASINGTSRELEKKKEQLIAILGLDKFTKAFDKKLKDLSKSNSSKQIKTQSKRKKSVAAEAEQLQLWQPYKEFKGHSVAFSPDGRYLSAVQLDRTTRIFDLQTGEEIRKLPGSLHAAKFSPDSQYVITTWLDKLPRIWNIKTGAEALKLEGHTEEINSATFSPDGRFIVTTSNDFTAHIWDAQTGKVIHVLKGHELSVKTAVFSRDSRQVLTASDDFTARLWDVETGKEIHKLEGHTSNVGSASFSSDERYIVTAAFDRTIRIWDTHKDFEVRSIEVSSDSWTTSAVFSPDDRHIVTSSWAGSVKIWDTERELEIHKFEGHREPLFSPDRKYLLTTSDDNITIFWKRTELEDLE